MNCNVARSYRYCEAIARRQAGNFYLAFRILPAPQRRAMCALYAFLRHTDDLSDGDAPAADRATALIAWREALDGALAGRPAHALHPALCDALARFAVPPSYLHATLDGVEMDLGTVRFATFGDLYRYCYRVASAVGLACVHIWGYRDRVALDYAEKAGIAFQLTNILRDLGEDAARGRVYLPQEDLERFGYTAEQLLRGEQNGSFHQLMGFEATRAERFYDESTPLTGYLSPAGRVAFRAMSGTYRGILQAVRASGYDVFRHRIRLPAWQKFGHVVRALPARWGWA